ncbi:MAG: 2-dehydro-3-deoxygalactonokinase [Devosiaceae bacterium]|nr:2-dehydro-3-deoxygalactonokinase [Devosiaceae bacterium]
MLPDSTKEGKLNWIALDWGTSNVRAWGGDGAGKILCSAKSDAGMGKLRPEEFEPALLDLVGNWLETSGIQKQVTIVCCGMAGARAGWVEATYQEIPCRPDKIGRFVSAPTQDKRLDVRILPGLSQNSPPDVMRGEETQIAGWLSKNPKWSGTICLPGTHSKWVEVKQGEVLGFSTFITGEMFNFLVEHSLLAILSERSVWNQDAFLGGINKGFSDPGKLTNQLFGLRARSLLEGVQNVYGASEISGLLIGLELGAMSHVLQGQKLMLIGAEHIVAHYQTAVSHLGGKTHCVSGEEMALAGLIAAVKQMGVIAP